MITVTFDKNNLVLSVEGHAKYAEKGKDIVCASVSTLFFTTAYNILEMFEEKDVDISMSDNGFGQICCREVNADEKFKCVLAFGFALTGFEMIERDYGEYVKLIVK